MTRRQDPAATRSFRCPTCGLERRLTRAQCRGCAWFCDGPTGGYHPETRMCELVNVPMPGLSHRGREDTAQRGHKERSIDGSISTTASRRALR